MDPVSVADLLSLHLRPLNIAQLSTYHRQGLGIQRSSYAIYNLSTTEPQLLATLRGHGRWIVGGTSTAAPLESSDIIMNCVPLGSQTRNQDLLMQKLV